MVVDLLVLDLADGLTFCGSTARDLRHSQEGDRSDNTTC